MEKNWSGRSKEMIPGDETMGQTNINPVLTLPDKLIDKCRRDQGEEEAGTEVTVPDGAREVGLFVFRRSPQSTPPSSPATAS
jgi:hypothetical protein